MTKRTVQIGKEKPHIRLKYGDWWVFQRMVDSREQFTPTHRRRALHDRVGRGATPAEAYQRFCSSPSYVKRPG